MKPIPGFDPFEKPKPDLTVEEMKADILQYVEAYDWVSIAELARRYDSQVRGDYSWGIPSANIILYGNLSEKMVSALEGLLRERKVHLHPAAILTYLIDGGIIRLPLARKPPVGGYKKPHWLPVCLRLGANCAMCLARTRRPK